MKQSWTNDRKPNYRDEYGFLTLIRCFNPIHKAGDLGFENYKPMAAKGECAKCMWVDPAFTYVYPRHYKKAT